jgi:hypothetical protein
MSGRGRAAAVVGVHGHDSVSVILVCEATGGATDGLRIGWQLWLDAHPWAVATGIGQEELCEEMRQMREANHFSSSLTSNAK